MMERITDVAKDFEVLKQEFGQNRVVTAGSVTRLLQAFFQKYWRADQHPLNAAVKFVFPDDPTVILVSREGVVSNDNLPADLEVTVSLHDIAGIMNRSLSFTTAYFLGKLKLQGDKSVAFRLQAFMTSYL